MGDDMAGDDVTARFIVGDVREELAKLADGSVDFAITSPPFLALRSYLPADHPDKAKEIGSEPTPAAFLDTLLELTLEFRRVLAPYGTLCVELGDTYAGSGGGGGDYLEGGWREGQPGFGGSAERQREGNAAHWRQKNAERDGWPLDKSLAGIPDLYQQSLAYGWNMADPWNGKRYPMWRIRNKLAWCRPNPPVGSLGGRTLKNADGEKIGKESGERFRSATSYVTVATVARDRWFDLDAVRTESRKGYTEINAGGLYAASKAKGPNESRGDKGAGDFGCNPAGAPPLDWHDDRNWQPLIDLPTAPYKGAHYATFPPELPRRLIEAMCPRQVCTTCGQPRRRIVAQTDEYAALVGKRGFSPEEQRGNDSHLPAALRSNGRGGPTAQNTTLGWTDCGHNTWRPGLVLDPFAGSGTTLAVAVGCGRTAIGIDLDPRNLDLARERVGMFLEEIA